MKEKYTKSWLWHRELKEDELIRRKMASGMPAAEAVSLVRPCTRRVRSVQTHLKWWTAADNLSVNYSLDGPDAQIHVWFSIPFLVCLAITFNCHWDWFKRTFPRLTEDGADLNYSLTVNRHYIAFYWGDREAMRHQKRGGIRWIKDWGDILRGENTKTTWSRAKLVAERDIRLHVTRPTARHPNAPVYQPTRVQVYEKVGTWHYSRWFSTKRKRFEVVIDQEFTIRGKGDNDWDRDSYVWTSAWDDERQQAGFSTGDARNAGEAIEQFVEHFNKLQQQR